MIALQSGWNPQKYVLFSSKLINRLLQIDQFVCVCMCVCVQDFLFPEYNKGIFHCFPERPEKHRVCTEGKIPFHPKTRADNKNSGSRMKNYCKLDRFSALALLKLALFHIRGSQGTRAATAKQMLSQYRPEIHLISPPFQPANDALQAESQATFLRN